MSVVITGMGLITAYGWGVDAYWAGLLAGSCALRPHPALAAEGFAHTVTGVVDAVAPPGTSRRSRLARAAAAEALSQAALFGPGGAGAPAAGLFPTPPLPELGASPRPAPYALRACPQSPDGLDMPGHIKPRRRLRRGVRGGAPDTGWGYLPGEALGEGGVGAKSAAPGPAPRALVVLVGQTPHADPGSVPRWGSHDLSGPRADDLPGIGPGAETVYLSQACASLSFALDYARTWLRSGCGTTALVVGTSVLNGYEYAGMAITGALSPTGARPFDVARDGTSLGEGAGALVLETADAARGRGARPLAVLAGAAARVNGRSPAASDEGAIADCISAALDDAGLDSVQYIHAHATGTVQGDTVELAALDAIGAERGWDAVPVSGHKGGIGHLMHASSAPGIAAALGCLRTGGAPGTPGLGTAESTGRTLRLLTAAEQLNDAPRSVLVNSFGFAGNNSSLVLTAPDGSTS